MSWPKCQPSSPNVVPRATKRWALRVVRRCCPGQACNSLEHFIGVWKFICQFIGGWIALTFLPTSGSMEFKAINPRARIQSSINQPTGPHRPTNNIGHIWNPPHSLSTVEKPMPSRSAGAPQHLNKRLKKFGDYKARKKVEVCFHQFHKFHPFPLSVFCSAYMFSLPLSAPENVEVKALFETQRRHKTNGSQSCLKKCTFLGMLETYQLTYRISSLIIGYIYRIHSINSFQQWIPTPSPTERLDQLKDLLKEEISLTYPQGWITPNLHFFWLGKVDLLAATCGWLKV